MQVAHDRPRKRWLGLVIASLVFLGIVAPLAAQEPQAITGGSKTYFPVVTSNPELDIHNRQSVVNFYTNFYLPSNNVTDGWTGNQATCDAGTTSQAYRDAILLRVNYFRKMAGLAAVTLNASYNSQAQQAALMMSRNNSLNHNPPTSWACYTTTGKNAAGKSNLYLGQLGPGAITGYMLDPGAGNSSAGHRRWILYPQTKSIGTGDVPSRSGYAGSNALYVITSDFGTARPATRTEYVPWPPEGFVPYQVVFGRWSFALHNGNFTNATISMRQGSTTIPVTKETVANGYGENTIVWIPQGYNHSSSWGNPGADTTYTITIGNVIVNSQTLSFTYNVTVINPNQ
ncbi:CAP domain-containing protein [Herpetosiphon sp. NSE202]|uniref:CAP domain-containing protein n=1 Tax=Herpetosiphon sp. NSE202 TaxID=3351349 RepID=UPI00363059C9